MDVITLVKFPKLGSETAFKYIKHTKILKQFWIFIGENKKFRRPSNFEYQKARDLIMSNNNLCSVVIENEVFKRPEVINMDEDIKFMEDLTTFLRNNLLID